MIHRLSFCHSKSGSFDDSLSECIDFIQLQQDTNTLLGVIFFIDASQNDSYSDSFRVIASAVHKNGFSFPYTVLAQAGYSAVTVELWLDDASCKTEYLTYNGHRYTRHQSEWGTFVWGLGLHHPNSNAPLQEQADETFGLLSGLLKQEGMSLSDIIRQWNYVPGILTIEQQQDKTVQHYQVFNEVRKYWYSNASFEKGYPAATGIGVKAGPFSIDFVSIKPQSSVIKKGLCNPKQENAYQYTQQHLIGDATYGKCKNPPLFERAKLLTLGDTSMVIVSGTAAILGQETVGVGDVRKQTEVTITNLLELLTPEVTGIPSTHRFNYLRVFVKHTEHLDTVKTVCDSYFPTIPITYVVADVCRDNLLMEIEGEAIN